MDEASVLATLTTDTRGAVRQLLAFARSRGIKFELREGLRSCARQNALYAQGRTTEGPVVTWVQGCNSWHSFGRAVDIYISERCADYLQLAEFWENQIGGKWGGRFPTPDCLHFELPHPDYKLSDLCPNPADCEAAVARQPAPSTPLVPLLIGLAVGIALAQTARSL